jgi:hypothetical protein
MNSVFLLTSYISGANSSRSHPSTTTGFKVSVASGTRLGDGWPRRRSNSDPPLLFLFLSQRDLDLLQQSFRFPRELPPLDGKAVMPYNSTC